MSEANARISPALDAARDVLLLAVGQGYGFVVRPCGRRRLLADLRTPLAQRTPGVAS